MPVQPPPELIKRYAEGNVVLFVGAGMSRPALPGWSDLLKQMIAWAEREKISLGGSKKSILGLIKKQKLTLAAQELRVENPLEHALHTRLGQ